MNRTTVDAWAWRTKGQPAVIEKALQAMLGHTGYPVKLQKKGSGWQGYEESARIVHGDKDLGLCAWGGQSQKGWAYVGMMGGGCDDIRDWDLAQQAACDIGSYELKRADIALDTFDRSVTFDTTLEAYRRGGFTTSGRPPKCEPMKPERPEDSAIIRIGSRKSDKYFRGYEKGKQVLGAQLVADLQEGAGPPLTWQNHDGRTIDGPGLLDWFRQELELKAQTGPLPEDVIDKRDQYFAGAYPYLGQVLDGIEPHALIVPRISQPCLDLAVSLEHIRTQWGSTLFTALVCYHGDIGAVWERIVGAKHCQRLVDAGVLMVDHLAAD